jgi:hypothetical protein
MISRILRRLRRKAIPCRSWAEAVARSHSYEDAVLCDFRAARSGRHVEACPPELLDVTGHVVDFGGGMGERARGIVAANPAARVTVVETPSMVARATPGDRVGFTSDIPAGFDIFYSNAALQYLEDPYALLRSVFDKRPHRVILVRNTFSEVDRFHVQRSRLFENGSGPLPSGFVDRDITYPHRTLRLSDVIAIAGGYSVTQLAEYDHLGGKGGGLIFCAPPA